MALWLSQCSDVAPIGAHIANLPGIFQLRYTEVKYVSHHTVHTVTVIMYDVLYLTRYDTVYMILRYHHLRSILAGLPT